jgi:phosphate-selective porin
VGPIPSKKGKENNLGRDMSEFNSSKDLERIEILINPDTLEYSLSCNDTYVEDIYVVLRELINCIETGEMDGTFKLEDIDSGKPVENTEISKRIRELKEQIDKEYQKRSFRQTTLISGRDYSN